jgi:hypothetical protein
MVIKNSRKFNIGALFAITFMGVLYTIFSPVFNGKNGLEFADQSFNKLAKGSSYFMPKVSKAVAEFNGKGFSASITLDKAEDAEQTAKLFKFAGAKAAQNGTAVTVEGDLGLVLQSALKDADAMYHNDGTAVSERYGANEKKMLQNWWQAFSKIEKNMKKDKQLAEAKIISEVMKKGIEPSYNFYEIDANKVSEHAGMLSGLLVFYVFYTMWWGYAIFYLFEGFGLTMKKAKVKKEA